MIHVFLFNEGSRASAYGIGTYVEQLSDIFSEANNILVFNIVLTRSKEEEFCVVKNNNVNYYYIPDALQDNAADSKINIYYRNVWLLMYPFFPKGESDKFILHLNYYQHSCFVDYFKRDFPLGKCCFAIHYMDWCFKIKGNKTYFEKIINRKKNAIEGEIEKSVLGIYEKEKLLFDKIDYIICLSDRTKGLLNNCYQIASEKMVVIFNGIKNEFISMKNKEKKMVRKELLFEKDEKIILFVGRLDEIKGVDKLIKAFRKIVTSRSDCRLILVGDGFYSQYLSESKYLWNKISFTGRLSKEELYKFYRIADIGVMPSFHEQCSYVAIEMMMHEIPLVASTTTGLSEMIEDKVTGLHIPIKEYSDHVEIDTEELANKILFLLQNPSVKKMIGQNARFRYEKLYTSQIVNENMLSFYQSLFS